MADNNLTLADVEEELAQLALCATRSEDFDEDRAQFLLDLQQQLIEESELESENVKVMF